jgi:hypothetical protein
MSVKGKLIDNISGLHASFYYNPDKATSQKLADGVQDLSAWLTACEEMVEGSPRYKSKTQKYEALWRTLICNSLKPSGSGEPDSSWAASYEAYRDLVDLELRVEAESSLPQVQTDMQISAVQEKRSLYYSQSYKYVVLLGNFASGRQSCSTELGYFGWAPFNAKPYDKVCIFQGYPIPFILRPVDSGGFKVLGDAYLHGLMEGEAIGLSDAPLNWIHKV